MTFRGLKMQVFVLGMLLPGPLHAKTAAPALMGAGAPSGPIVIEADVLEVRDKEKVATYSGNVVVKRGDMTLRAARMKAFYDASAAAPAAPGMQPGQQVRRLEMDGKILFMQKDQQATGDRAVYERASGTLVLTGQVVLTQGQNVARGTRLAVDMTTGQARLEGRPQMILIPNDAQKPAPAGR